MFHHKGYAEKAQELIRLYPISKDHQLVCGAQERREFNLAISTNIDFQNYFGLPTSGSNRLKFQKPKKTLLSIIFPILVQIVKCIR